MPADGLLSSQTDLSQTALDDLEQSVLALRNSADELDVQMQHLRSRMETASEILPRINDIHLQVEFDEYKEKVSGQARDAQELLGESTEALSKIQALKEDLSVLSEEDRNEALVAVAKAADALHAKSAVVGSFGATHQQIDTLANQWSKKLAGTDDDGAYEFGTLSRDLAEITRAAENVQSRQSDLEKQKEAYDERVEAILPEEGVSERAPAEPANIESEEPVLEPNAQRLANSLEDASAAEPVQAEEVAPAAPVVDLPVEENVASVEEPASPPEQPVLRTVEAEEPPASPAAPSGTPATTFGTPLATSTLGAIADGKGHELTLAEEEAEETPKDTTNANLANALKALDEEEAALNKRYDDIGGRKDRRLSETETLREQAAVLHGFSKVEQGRLELLQKHGDAVKAHGLNTSEAELRSNIANALTQLNYANLRQLDIQAKRTGSVEAAATADKLRLALEAVQGPSGSNAAISPKTLANLEVLRNEIETAYALRRMPQETVTSKAAPAGGIEQARSELRVQRAAQSQNDRVYEVYQERMRTKSLEWLEGHDPVRFQQYQTLQAQSGTVTVDPVSFLNNAEQRSIQLEVLVDVRAEFPDVTDEALSLIMLTKSVALLQAADALDAAATVATGVAFLTAGQTVAAAAQTAAALAPMAAGALNTLRDTQRQLLDERKQDDDRAQQIVQVSTQLATAPTPQAASETRTQLETLQKQQRGAPARQRALQVALQGQLAALGSLKDVASRLAADPTDVASTDAAVMLVHQLENSGFKAVKDARRTTTATPDPRADGSNPEPTADGALAPAVSAIGSARPTDIQDADTAAARDAHTASTLSRLQAGKLRARPDLQLANKGTRAAGSAGGPTSTAGSVPLLALPTKAKTDRERFAAEGELANQRVAQFGGVGLAAAGGYESMFSDGGETDQEEGAVQRDRSIEDGADGPSEEDPADLEARRAADLMEQQQAARAQSPGGGQSALDVAKKINDIPGGKQAVGNAAKAAVANPVGLVVLVLVLVVWLNARLLFPKEGSFFRKPLGTFGIMGVIAFDFLFVFLLMFSLLITIISAIIPFLPILLPLGGAFAILQAAFHIF